MSLPFSYSLSNEKVKQKIAHLINEINQFNDIEKLLLYIQLPSGSPANDPLKHKGPGNPFGKKADVEVAQTYTWIQSHLEEDPTVSLPKHEVYDEYRFFCQTNSFEPLCVADFGKAMKHVFPGVKPRRLGQRGNSKYCYSGLRKRLTLPEPCLPDLSNTSTSLNNNSKNGNVVNNGKTNGDERRINKSNSTEEDSSSDPSSSTGVVEAFRADGCAGINSFNINSDNNINGISNIYGKHQQQHIISPDIVQNATTRLILDWAEGILEQNFTNLQELGKYLINYDLVDKTSVAAIALISSSAPAPPTPTTPGSLSTSLPLATQEDVKFNSNSRTMLTNQQIKSKRGDIMTQSSGQTKKSLMKEVSGNNRRKGNDRSAKSVSVNDSGFAISSTTTNQQSESVTLTRGNRRSRRLSLNGNGRSSMAISSDCASGVNGDNNDCKTTDHLHLNIKKERNQQLYDVDGFNMIENTSTTAAAAVATTNTTDENKTGSVMLKNSISQNKISINKGDTSSSSHQLIVLPNNVRLTSTTTRSMSQILTGDKSGSQSVPVSCLSSSITTSSLAASSTKTSSPLPPTTTSSLSSSSSSTIKSISLTSPPSLSAVTQKYKRIQPKPVSLNRSNSNVLESTFNYSTINEHKTSTLSSSSTSNNTSNNNNKTTNINSSQNRNNNLKSNEVEGLIVTRRHSLASVTLTGNELQSTNNNCNNKKSENINFTRRESVLGLVVTGCGVNGGELNSPSSSSSSSSSSSCSSSPCIKDERISLDKTQIKRSCDVSRDSDNVSCKKRLTSLEGCESIKTVSPPSASSSSISSTLLSTTTTTTSVPTSTTLNGNLAIGGDEGGIILTLANGDTGGRLSDETNSSSTSLSPLPSMSMTENALLTGLTDNGLNDLNGDSHHHHNQNMLHHQQQLGLMNITNNKTSTSEMCIKLQELECDALNDDLNEQPQPQQQQQQQQQHGASSSLMDSYEDCNPSTLSQLRRLLEKNLPNSKSSSITVGLSSSSSSSSSSAISSEHINNANIINNNGNHHSHHHQHHIQHQHNSPNNVNNINITNINHGNHEIMEQQIVGYEETTHHHNNNNHHHHHHHHHHQQQQQQHNLNHLHNVDGDIKLEEKKDIIGSNTTSNSFGLTESSLGKKSIDCNSPMLISNVTESESVFISDGSLNSIVNNSDTGNDAINSMVSSMDYCNMQTQVPSVPASPNTRRQAFNFQPISSRITPTIPENSAIGNSTSGTGSLNNNIVSGVNGSSNTQQPQHSSPSFSSNQRSIGVGLSQPPSSANSPFVSPRGTPIPLSRSRHDSGQSGYSGSRATPYPVLIDSGLSSISSSPFISPQSTPVPLSGRMRAISNSYSHHHHHTHHTRSSLVNRARHSSGPGNPYTTLPSSITGSSIGTFSMRSSSVSPMVVSSNGNDLLTSNGNSQQQGATLASINAAFGEVRHRTRNQSSTTTGTTTTSGVSSIGTPVSPKSEPLSPSSALISGDNMSTSDLASIGIGSSSSSANDDSFMDSSFSSSRDWLTNNSRYLLSGYHGNGDHGILGGGGTMGSSNNLLHGGNGSEGSHVGPVLRQRHFSSPYATIANNGNNNFSLHDSHSKEIQNLLKGSSFIESLLSNNNNHTNNHHHSENNINDSGENSNGSSLTGNLPNGGGDHHLSGSSSSTLTSSDQQQRQHHVNNGRPLLNRCHSVPIQHLGKLYNGLSTASSVPSPSIDHNSFTPSSSLCSPADPNSPPDRDFSSVSKSYPPTPLCNPNFSFPPFSPSSVNNNSRTNININTSNNNCNAGSNKPNSGANSISSPNSVGSARLKLVEEETTLGSLVVDNSSTISPSSNSGFLENGQDVMVSGLQSKEWSVAESVMGSDDIELTVNHTGHHYHHHQQHHHGDQGQHHQHLSHLSHHHNPHDPDLSPGNGLLNTFEVRRAIDDAISGPTPMSDDLETTLEDLRDCDNDFSKFALELELEANGSTKFDDI